MRRVVLGTTCAIAMMIAPSPAAAEQARVTLTFSIADAIVTCPDEPTFRGLVSARLGYDPFAPDGIPKLAVSLRGNGAFVVGQLTLTGARGEALGTRRLRVPADECFELATSLALAVAVAIDPDAVGRTGAAPAQVTPDVTQLPPVGPPPQPPPPPPARPISEGRRAATRLELGAHAAWGVVPSLRGGGRVGLAFDATSWSLGVEGTLVTPGSETGSSGTVTAFAGYLSFVPCFHSTLAASVSLDLCIAASAGVLRSTARDVDIAVTSTDPLATIGPRVGATVMPWGNVGFAAATEVPVALSRVTLAIADSGVRTTVWTTPAVGWGLHLSLVLRLG